MCSQVRIGSTGAFARTLSGSCVTKHKISAGSRSALLRFLTPCLPRCKCRASSMSAPECHGPERCWRRRRAMISGRPMAAKRDSHTSFYPAATCIASEKRVDRQSMRRSRTIAIQCAHGRPSLPCGSMQRSEPDGPPTSESASQVFRLSPRMIGRSFIWASRRMGPLQPFSSFPPKCFVRLIPDPTPAFPPMHQTDMPARCARTLSSSHCMPRRLHCSSGSRSEEPDATKGGRPAVTLWSLKFGSNIWRARNGDRHGPKAGWLAGWPGAEPTEKRRTSLR